MQINHRIHAFVLAATLIAGGTLPASAFFSSEFESNLHRSFSVSPGGKLVVTADRGSIDLTIGETEKLEVEVLRKINRDSKTEADKAFSDHHVSFQQQGNQITVTAENQSKITFHWGWNNSQLQVKYRISLPRKFNVNLKTFGGSITVADLLGDVECHTSGGGLKLGKIGGAILGETFGGSIAVAASSGSVEVKTSGGGIDVGEVDGNVQARTFGGSIHVKGAKGRVEVSTSGGGIEIGEVDGDVEAQTHGGSIHVRKARGKVVATTSGGGIDLDEVQGAIEAKTFGGSITAGLLSQPKGTSHLQTSGGGIRVGLVDNVGVDLNATSRGGRVVTEIPATATGEVRRGELRGKINGGGPALVLETFGGSILVKKM